VPALPALPVVPPRPAAPVVDFPASQPSATVTMINAQARLVFMAHCRSVTLARLAISDGEIPFALVPGRGDPGTLTDAAASLFVGVGYHRTESRRSISSAYRDAMD